MKFSEPVYGPNVISNILELIENPDLMQSSFFTNKIQGWFKEKYSFANIFLTTSCSAALLAIAMALRIKKHGTIIVPSWTFTSTASCFESVGFTIKYADIDPETQCLEVQSLEELYDENTVGVVTTNYAGYVRNHGALREWCNNKKVLMIEDAAHSFHSYFGTNVGQLSDFATLSFHHTKNLSCGEGGALIVNNLNYLDEIQYILNKGTNRHSFQVGKVDKYEWVYRGSNFIMSEFAGAILYSSLIDFDSIMKPRIANWNFYHNEIAPLLRSRGWIINPNQLEHEKIGHHIFFAISPSTHDRQLIQEYFKHLDIPLLSHYPNLQTSPFGKKFVGRQDIYFNATVAAERLIRFPLHSKITEDQREFLHNRMNDFFSHVYR